MEEKAKAYDEALERARAINNGKDVDIEAGTTICEYIFPELKENEDGKMWKLIKKYVHSNISDMALKADHITRKQLETWLEKQEFVNKEYTFKAIPRLLEMIQPTDRAKSYCQKLIDSLEQEGYSTDATIVRDWLKTMNGEKVAMATMDEQKVANETEPKFKVGDWIVNKTSNLVYRVDSILFPQSKCYYLSHNGEIVLVNFTDEQNYRPWTIRDAREGDVLSNDNHILILKELVYDWSSNGTPYSVKAYCGINPNGNFEIGKDNWCFCGTLHIHPATKEQCNTLKKAMAGAEYIFDFDKKELKKIEDEPNKCEGCNNVKGCIACVDGSEWARIEEQKPADNIEPTSTWSGDDEKRIERLLGWIDTLINYIHHDVTVSLDLRRERMQQVEQFKTWLKSLQLQNTWKPSDEQMHAFEQVYDWYNNNFAPSETLTSLYNDLKKLKG